MSILISKFAGLPLGALLSTDRTNNGNACNRRPQMTEYQSYDLLKDFSSICEPLRHPVGLDLHSDRMVRPLGFPNGSPTLEKNPEKIRFARRHEFL
jgi:hypothetical protein